MQKLILLLCTLSMAIRGDNHTSQTFMFAHPLFKNIILEQLAWDTFFNTVCSDHAIHGIGLYQHSLPQTGNASYFLLPEQTVLTVAGDNTPEKCTRDIRAEWLGIADAQFRGKFSLQPTQKQYGALITYYHSFELSPQYGNWWFTLMLPILTVQNTLRLRQFDINNALVNTQAPFDIITAFNQPAWTFAKISPSWHKSWGITEIDLRMGKLFHQPRYDVGCYAGLTIPTAPSQNAAYLFNPFLGNNGHMGALIGVTTDVSLNTHCSWFLSFESTFLWPNHQYRTFDLHQQNDDGSVFIKKPLSRYIMLNQKDAPPNAIPGVNILTQRVNVHPYAFFNAATGIRIQNKNNEIEIGYTLWGRSDEKITLHEPFPEIYGIAGTGSSISPLTGCPSANSASKSTIAFQAPNDPEFVVIRAIDLDLHSAEGKGTINNQVHFDLKHRIPGESIDTLCAFGAWYEIPTTNSTLTLWAAWLLLGLTF